MKDEYIRKQDAVEALYGKVIVTGHKNADAVLQYMEDVSNKIKALPSADVVEVVRCKDCKFREDDDFCIGRGFPYQLVPDDGFCDKGERQE